jgi:cbb3-type cytochrome oxidase cytochrome c subunit
MNKLLVIIVLLIVAIACNKKAIPVISERTTDPPPPVSPVANITPDHVAGQRIFMNRCSKCHDLPDPGKYKAERWEGILRVMDTRAGLSREQEVHLNAYVKANAAK